VTPLPPSDALLSLPFMPSEKVTHVRPVIAHFAEGAISFDAVRHLLLCRIERRPPCLDMANWPHLPPARVRTTRAADYMSLLASPARETTL
jgi:hypothetical protein